LLFDGQQWKKMSWAVLVKEAERNWHY